MSVPMVAGPCELHIRVRQTVTRAPIVYVSYRVTDLAAMWCRSPSTIHVWLSILRHHPMYPPVPPYVRRVQTNVVRRHLEIRSDYAELLRAIFIDRQIVL